LCTNCIRNSPTRRGGTSGTPQWCAVTPERSGVMASFSLSRGVEPRRRRGPKDGEVEAARGSWPAGDDRGGTGARGLGRGHARSGRRMTGAARAREDEETTARDVRPAGTAGDGRDGGGRPGRRRRMRTRTRGTTGGGGEDEPRAAAALEARRSEE